MSIVIEVSIENIYIYENIIIRYSNIESKIHKVKYIIIKISKADIERGIYMLWNK